MNAMKSFTHSPTVRLVTLGILALILLIPQFLVDAIVSDRQYSYSSAQRSIAEPWGQEQTIVPPRIAVPYSEDVRNSKGQVVRVRKGLAFVLPDSVDIQADVSTEYRYRGIYRSLLDQAKVSVTGEFASLQNAVPHDKDRTYFWGQVVIFTNVSDLVGLKSLIRVDLDSTPIELKPGLPSFMKIASDGDKHPLSATFGLKKPDLPLRFSYTYELNGSEAIHFLPLAGTTHVQLHTDYPHPSFVGAQLPSKRTITDSTTEAEWKILYVNRNSPQQYDWNFDEDGDLPSRANAHDYYYEADSRFGMKFRETHNLYDLVERAVKYGILLIVFTFLTFFFTDQFTSTNIPIVGYLLVGLALILFYTLLLSIAEYLSFGPAYLIAALAITAQISAYLYGFVRQMTPVIFCAGVLGILYTFLYIILRMETFPLLVGSIFLFLMLGLVMYLSQRMSWTADPTQP
ncbi:MAG: hypothetical protein CSA07_01740 [Bacteroidia bacterium]|nr:MAG: hypothetical protein CSA07_01740 [Bacteroidia bacterium]